jgi:hypothetical protein
MDTRSTTAIETSASAPRLTSDQVWRQVAKQTFAVISQVTPGGAPRSSGVMYKAIGTKLFVVTDPRSWKAKHLAADGHVAVTVPVHRGGILALVAPIPPATISFHGTAVVHPAGTMTIPEELAPLIPPDRRSDCAIIEIAPEGAFVTYGVGVPLLKMRIPERSRARVPVAG